MFWVIVKENPPFLHHGTGHNSVTHTAPVAVNAAAKENWFLLQTTPRFQAEGAGRRQKALHEGVGIVGPAALLAVAAAALPALRVDELHRHVAALTILQQVNGNNVRMLRGNHYQL